MAPIPAYLVIRQTYFTVSARLLSDQSSSETVSTRLLKAADGVLTLSAVYRNTPRMNVRSTSPMHFGSFIVELQRDPVDRLVGHYWTDRGSGGDMEFVQHAATAAAGFEQASKLTFTP